MTTQVISDAESIARQQSLLSAMLRRAAHYAAVSAAEASHGHGSYACEFALLSSCCKAVADKARARLVDISGLALSDVEDAPPSTLVELVDWLRGKLGRWLPWVRSEDWQTIGMLLMRGRP